MTKNKIIGSATEYDIQCQFVEYLTLLKQKGIIRRFSALPLSTYTESFAAKAKNIKSGVRAGVPDLLILTKTKTIFIELKKSTGILSEAQKNWIYDLKEAGSLAIVCYSLEEAKNFIDLITDQEQF